MKKTLFLLLALLGTIGVQARKDPSARRILDTTAEMLQKQGGFKITFSITTFQKDVEQGRTSGTMLIDGKRFRVTTPDLITWFDGTTQWSYLKANEEVNVSTPTEEELQSIYPYAFISIYKRGYHYTMKEVTLRGKAAYEITLMASKEEQQPRLLLLDVDKSTHLPLCVRLFDGQNWLRIAITECAKGQTFKDKEFCFNAKDYPQAEIIDMR